jgi:acetyl-CoA C-acetyltransferase
MPEAVIVSAVRSPIGRAVKGSLRELRPDDLAARMVRTALDQLPALDPSTIDDLLLGCGAPGGEHGFNLGRMVAILLGLDTVPGATITRYCSSSVQTTRMAMHAIRAGEGHTYISAGVECVSHYAAGTSDTPPAAASGVERQSWHNPAFGQASARTAQRAAAGSSTWTDPRAEELLPDAYIAMGLTAENVAATCGVSRHDQDEFAVRSQNRAEEAIASGFWKREITPITLSDGSVVAADDCPRRGVEYEAVSRLEPGVPTRRHGNRRELLPAQRRCSSACDHERH